ncbi:MAG TPA: TetR/AcrR family transcriptional regulator [Acidimicrobiales bacterium]|nr:TetR/AcrR family transcriptional regulator [Acidimicrobiales bacterium]
MANAPRTRLEPEARRAQLVGLGLQMLSTRPLDKVAIDDIAAEAGISRGLLFHYFPTKRDFHLAVARAAARQLLDRTQTDPALPPIEQLRAGVEAFVDHLTDNRDAYVAFIRGSSGGDPELLQVYESTRTAFTGRVLAGLGIEPVTTRLRTVVRGWVAFTEEVTVDWLSGGDLEREELITLLNEALVSLVTGATGGWPLDDRGMTADRG